MHLPRECYQMQKTIETHLPHLSQPQLTGLVLWVCGAILAGSACQNAVASALSPWRNWNNLRQYLREWLYDGSDRARPCQTELDASLCFAPLLRWVLTWWCSGRLAPVSSTGQALAVDPTLKGDETTAIVISVVYRSCAIPVAWRIHRATQRGSWMDPTVELLRELAPAVPRDMTVIVLCDRGISSPKLWQQIRAQSLPPATTGGLASLYALPEEHHLLRRRRQTIACPRRRLRSRHCLDRPRHRLRPTCRPAPLHPAGGLVRRAGRTLDHPHRPAAGGRWTQLVRPALLDRTGLQSLPSAPTGGPSKAWAGSGTRPEGPIRRGSPATGWCCRWRRCWPWPMAPGWKTPMTAGLPQATCAHRPRRRLPGAATPGAGRYGPSASSATASTGCGGCCSGAASGAASGCCPNPGRNPSPTWKSPTMPLPENPLHTLVRAQVPEGAAAGTAWGPAGKAATAGHGGPERIPEGMPGVAGSAADL